MTVRRILCVVAVWGLAEPVPASAQLGWLTRAGDAVREQLRTDRPRVVRRSIELDGASLETLQTRLGWFGITIPLELRGDVTARLGAEVDLSSLRDASSYRITGSLSSRSLVVEGLSLRDLSASVRYVDGRMTLDQLVVTVPDSRPNAPAGRAVGTAALQLLPVGALTATLRLSEVPLEPFARRIEAAESLYGGRLTGRLNVEAPLSNLRDIRSWRGTGQLALADLAAAGRDVRRAETAIMLAGGALSLADLSATIAQEPVTGTGTLHLSAPFRYQIALAVPEGNLSRLEGLLDRELPETWNGGYRLTAQAVGTLRPFALDADGAVSGGDWTVAGTLVESFKADLESDGATVTLSRLEATALEGRWTGEGNVAVTAPYAYDATLALSGLDLASTDSLPEVLDPGVPLRGLAAATFTAEGTIFPRVVNAAGEIVIAGLAVRNVAFETGRFAGRLTPDSIEVKTLELTGPDGRLSGEGAVRLGENRTFSFRLQPERFDLAALDPVVSVALRSRDGEHEVEDRNLQASFQEGEAPAEPQPTPANASTSRQTGALDGVVTGAITAQGNTLPFKLDSLDGSLAFDGLTIAGVSFDRAELTAKTENRTLVLSQVLLTRGEGRLTGEGRFALDAPGGFTATFRSEAFLIDEARPLFGTESIAGFELPPISGQLDGVVTASGETQPFSLDSLEGNISGDDVRIGRLLVNRFEATAATENRTVTIPSFLVSIEDGRLTGRASLGLEGERPFEATLRPESFRMELLRPLFGEGGLIETDFPPVAGRVTGDVTLRGRAAPAAVDGVSGRVSASDAVAFGIPIRSFGATIASENGEATIDDVLAEFAFGRLVGSGNIRLSTPYDYGADLRFKNFDLSAVGTIAAGITEQQRPDIDSPAEVAKGPGILPIELEGLADLYGIIGGTLSPFVLAGEGRAASERLVLDARELNALFHRTTLTTPSFSWRYDENRLTLSDIASGLGGGTLSGTAAVPLGDAAAGSFDLRIDSVELSDVLTVPGNVGGVATGAVSAQLGPAGEDGERPTSGKADLAIPSLRVGRVAAGNVTATVDLKTDRLAYDVSGRLFDGALATSGTWPIDESARDAAKGTFRWTGANLARAAATMSDATRIAGRLDVAADYDLSATTKATGNVELSDVRNGRDLLTDRLRARVVWADSVIRVENAAGGFAGGTVSFAVLLNADAPSRGTVEVILRRADARRAFGWIPGLEPLTGTADLRLQGRLGTLWRWRGDGEVTRGTYGPIAFSSFRVPLDIDANPRRGAMRIEARRAAVRAARGRGVVNVTVDVGPSPRLDLEATFDELDAGQILAGFGERAPGGRISGRADLSARNLRSLADLNGAIAATLRGSQAQNLPIVGSVVDIIRLPTGSGGTVDRGELRANLRRGVARVETLSLAGPNFRLFADGTVALASQRLSLNVVADTSPARADRILAAFLLRQFIDYATPIGWLERANRFIAERSIYLRVTGTISRPNVRIRPVEQLGQEAVRFFLNELAGPVAPEAVPSP